MAATTTSSEGEWQDLLNSGGVLKQIIRPAPEEAIALGCPEYKQQVLVHVVGRTAKLEVNREFLNTRAEAKPISAYVGEPIMDMLPPGLMLCVRGMFVGEIARVKLESKYAYALGGHWYGLAPETDCEFEIELLSIGELLKEVPEQTVDELVQTMHAFKERGNEFFKWNELNKALRCYKEGVRFGDGLFGEQGGGIDADGKYDVEAYKDRVSCISNIAAVLEKQGKLVEAMESTVLALTADPSHLKSLARATRIAVAQGSHEEASAALKVALELAPGNLVIVKLQRELNEKIAQHKQLERERYGGFLKPVSPQVSAQLAEKHREEMAAKRQLEQLELAAERLREENNLKEDNLKGENLKREELDEESTPVEDDGNMEEEIPLLPVSSSFENSLPWKLFVLLFPTLFVLLAMLVPKFMAKL
ncbi:hypothetical protein BASA81_002116 [Batrachochytrium salamandrivorans]|nr:hypothetical protein BASA81_002116 [Batrachochytrium salamandrivorans]